MTQRVDRRQFVGGSAAALGYFFTANAYSAARAADGPNDKIHIAGIGVGGKGDSDIKQAGKLGEVVALCDIDENTLGKQAKTFPQAKHYFDFRKMLDEMGKDIDAVTVSTPDHTHAPAAVRAMRMKKHVYCQKPLTHSVFEARVMAETARSTGVCTQMGNQGTAADGLRRGAEIIMSGLLGPVKEFHVWTNRPIWPQAPKVMERPKGDYPVPAHVHWDDFLGPAPERPYAPGYHPFAWRGWWDFGTGALGDMACHTANLAYMGLKLGYPTSVVAEAGDVNPETCPAWAHVTWEFPARGEMAPVTFHWYEGRRDNKKMLPPEELLKKVLNPNEKLSDSGSLIVGEKAMLFSPNDYGESFRITPDIGVQTKKPESMPSNNGGDQGMKNEWVKAMRENKPEICISNFGYGGRLTEIILLGNVAIRAGKKLEWDGANLKTGDAEADRLVQGTYRKGWEVTREA